MSDAGNAALWTLCFTTLQREIWSWPSYDFLVKVRRRNGVLIPVIRAEQVSLFIVRDLYSFLLLYTNPDLYSTTLAPILPAIVRRRPPDRQPWMGI